MSRRFSPRIIIYSAVIIIGIEREGERERDLFTLYIVTNLPFGIYI